MHRPVNQLERGTCNGADGSMEALRRKAESVRFIQVGHEEAAAFMTCGYAKFTGRLGVCLATSGPGGIHLLNGLYDAKLDGQPVLAITGMPYSTGLGSSTRCSTADAVEWLVHLAWSGTTTKCRRRSANNV
jgi:thiamine pyrophosphate-dependent acetolactate synthase large subunit-like protein